MRPLPIGEVTLGIWTADGFAARFSTDEFAKMLLAAEKGPSIQHVTGPDRAILYIVGDDTGFRRNEIGSVTRKSFDFVSEPPTLTVEAGHSKHRRKDVIPLRADFAQRIKTWLAGKDQIDDDEPLFDIADKRTAEMIRDDMVAVREEWIKDTQDDREREAREESTFLLHVDSNGHVVDFHALRKTFITNLTRSGVTPKTAQLLARHSDINLTMNTYTMLGVHDQATAVEALPPIPNSESVVASEPAVARATGTDGKNTWPDRPKMVPTMVPKMVPDGSHRHRCESHRIAPKAITAGDCRVTLKPR